MTFDKSKLKGVLDTTLSYFTSTIPFTTAPIQIDSQGTFGALIRKFVIVNNDNLNNLSYQQENLQTPLKTLPVSSERPVTGWEDFIRIVPNAVSGSGYIELELIKMEDALLPKFKEEFLALREKQIKETSYQEMA